MPGTLSRYGLFDRVHLRLCSMRVRLKNIPAPYLVMPLEFDDDASDYIYILLIARARPYLLLLYCGDITDEGMLAMIENLASGRINVCPGARDSCYCFKFHEACKCCVITWFV